MLFSSLSSLCFDRSMMTRSFSSSPASISTSRCNVFSRGENERFPPRVCSAKATASVSSSKGRESKKKNAIVKKGVGLKVSSFRCASSSSSSSESSSFEAGGGGGGKEGKNTSASPKEEEKEEEKKESSGLEKAGFVLDKENNQDHLVKVVVDRVKSIEEQEDFSLDWAPVVLRALDGADRVLPLFSGNKKNQILEVLFHEMKKGGKEESESNETITYHEWEGRIHAGFENAEAVVVCERGDELDEDETTGENLTISSMFENILKEAVELSRVDWETLAKWQDITKEEEKRGPTRSARHPSSSSSNSKFSIKIVDSDGAINTRDWQILKSILRKDILPQSQKTFDLPNDSEVLLSLLVTLVKNLPIYATRQVLEKYSKSHEWGLSYRRGHSAPRPHVKRHLIVTDDLSNYQKLVDLSDGFIENTGLYRKDGDALFFIMETFKSYDRMLKHSQDAKNSPKKKRQGGPMYRRDMDQLIFKRFEVALFIQQQSARFMEDGNLEDDFLTALYQHPRLQKLQDEINEILSLEKRDCDAAKKIIDLEVAVQREDYETAATLRESLRLLNNITWVYLRGDQQNPFDD